MDNLNKKEIITKINPKLPGVNPSSEKGVGIERKCKKLIEPKS